MPLEADEHTASCWQLEARHAVWDAVDASACIEYLEDMQYSWLGDFNTHLARVTYRTSVSNDPCGVHQS